MKQTNGPIEGSDQESSTPITTTKTSTNESDKKQSSPQNKPASDSQPQPSHIPCAKALYDFQMNPIEDEGCLKFQKGMIIQVTRRVDQNWAEGKLGESVGIFPLSFVHLNQAATALMQSYATKWRLPASMPPNSDQTPSTSTSPQRQYSQQPPLQPTPVHPSPIRPTSPPSNPQVKTSPPSTASSPVSKDKTGVYIALHNYTPLKADELELKKGSQYIVKEACQDGWLKGCCSENLFKRGVFPGNYVMPLAYHQKMMAMQRNAALQAHKNQTNSNTQQMRSTGAYTNLGLSSVPPELPQRNIVPSARTGPPSSVQSKPEASCENASTAQTQKTDESCNKMKRESVTEMLMKKLGYTRKSNDSSAYSMDNPVFDGQDASSASPKPNPSQYNHMRSGSCPIDLGITNVNLESLQFGSQRVKIRERSALPM
jgi:Variant SH3 domain/SH3 domain